jgi:hypothetical protein
LPLNLGVEVDGTLTLTPLRPSAAPIPPAAPSRLSEVSSTLTHRNFNLQIRLEILNILRRNGIKEGHRPGIECQFLKSWHQKLHSNTTVEDIYICQAYIVFLGSDGDPAGFWCVLSPITAAFRPASKPHALQR